MAAVCAAWLVLCASAMCRAADVGPQGTVVGLAFVARMVADLDQSLAFYKAIGFSADPAVNTAWRKDKDIDRLYGVTGIQTRTAELFVVNEASGQRFSLYLRQVKGIRRRNRAGHAAWAPGATHFSLVVPDAPLLWAQLQAGGLLRARSWGGPADCPAGTDQGDHRLSD